GGRQLLSLSPTAIPVNTFTAGRQFESDTASSAAGSVVVWTTDVTTGAQHDIRAQMFKPDGTKKGSEILVNLPHDARFDESAPKVAMNSNGEFVVVWQDLF